MARIERSPDAFLRRMQISRHNLWFLVEGLLDRPFYSQIAASNPDVQKLSYTFALAQELAEGNGKAKLLSMCQVLASKKAFNSSFKGKTIRVVVFLDKDIDDLLGIAHDSPFVIYTEHYTLENYLILHNDLVKGVANAAKLDIDSIRARITTDSFAWSQKVASLWKDWIHYCIFVNLNRIGYPSYKSETSQFNDPPYQSTDYHSFDKAYEQAFTKSNFSKKQFDDKYDYVTQKLDCIFKENKHNSVFNGKWYFNFLACDAEIAAGSRQFDKKDLPARIRDCLLSSLDFQQPWTQYFHERISKACT
jgi:hypothetical protein